MTCKTVDWAYNNYYLVQAISGHHAKESCQPCAVGVRVRVALEHDRLSQLPSDG